MTDWSYFHTITYEEENLCFCPFRANKPDDKPPQGVALGYGLDALSGRTCLFFIYLLPTSWRSMGNLGNHCMTIDNQPSNDGEIVLYQPNENIRLEVKLDANR